MSPMGQKQTYAAHKLMSALPPKADINASVYRPCWLLPPIIAVIGGYASRPLLHLSRSAVGELFLLEVVFRQVAINELANHRGQRICFGIAAIDGHYAHVVCAFEDNPLPPFARSRDRQAFPKYAGTSARAYLEA